MLARCNAKRLEHLNVTEVEGFVIGAIEGDLDNGSGGPGINSHSTFSVSQLLTDKKIKQKQLTAVRTRAIASTESGLKRSAYTIPSS